MAPKLDSYRPRYSRASRTSYLNTIIYCDGLIPSAGLLTFYTSSLIVYLASGRCRPHTKLLAYCVPNTPVFCGAVHHVVRFEQLAKFHALTP